MRALDLKMLRDLRRIWAQTLAIALVLGCGIMVMVGAQSTQRTLAGTQAAYYERHRFGDVFAGLSRAPLSIVDAAATIDGVAQAEGRIGFGAVLDIAGMDEPATGRIVSLPATGARLNLPYLVRGRLPRPEHSDEVAINSFFGEANQLVPGSTFGAILNGRLTQLTVTGWVLSPEFVYAIAPGSMFPDNRRYGVIWLNEAAAAAAMDMGGAVNEIALRLTRDADSRAVIAALDDLLAPYGGTGAYGRDRQMSHAFLAGELQQLGVMSTYMPPVFLLVSAFLVNMVLGRLITMERPQIGLMKAVGYGTGDIVWHYLKLALLIGVIGVALGWLIGWWMGTQMIALYQTYFGFPFLLRSSAPGALALSGVLGLATVVLGGIRAVWASAQLAPAVAMSPPAPPKFSRGRVDRAIAWMRVRQTTMMILRSILRWPGRAAITLFGVAASVGVLVMSYFMFDSVDLLASSMFDVSNRQQVTLSLSNAAPQSVVIDALTLPGVRVAEGAFSMPARLLHGHRNRLSGLLGHFDDADLARLIDDLEGPVTLPADGVVVPRILADALDLHVGDTLRVEMLAPPREVLELPVARIITQSMGQEAHIRADALFAAMRIAPQVNQINLLVEGDQMPALNRAIKATPAVAGLADWADMRRQFDATLSENLLTMVSIYTLIGVLIAIGVIYNAARIQVSERSHELASLRVLGFTRAEVGFVLVGEMMLLTLVAIPLGWGLGYLMSRGLVTQMATDLYSIPFVITRSTFAYAALVVFVAALAAVLLVRRRLDRVDLASALKARE